MAKQTSVKDRTYSINIDVGPIKIEKEEFNIGYFEKFNENVFLKPNKTKKPKKKGQSIQKALISFRWTTHKNWAGYGGEIVVTKQLETTDESLRIAKEIRNECKNILLENNRFLGKKEEFENVIQAWIPLLESKGFYNLKKAT